MIAPLLAHPRNSRPKARTSATSFCTVGYEQNDPASFLKLLDQRGVELVIDVRQMPLSRKKGFSKNQLRALLAGAGIDYLHMQTLGAPKEIRNRLRENGSWPEYVLGYEKVLKQRQDDIQTLIELAQQKRICLLCFERRPEECHRSLVAAEMEKLSDRYSVLVDHIRY